MHEILNIIVSKDSANYTAQREKRKMKKKHNFKDSTKGISAVFLALIIVIVAIAASVAVYAWISGYIAPQVTEPHLDHFTFSYIETQTTGIPFEVTIRAMDQADHLYTDYSGTNELTSTVPISPESTATFVDGVWTGEITVSEEGTWVTISTSGGGKSGTSNEFVIGDTVPYLDHFTFDAIELPVMYDEPFNITIRARDQYGTSFHDYDGRNVLTVNSGTITPYETTPFVNGEWFGSVTIKDTSGETNWINTNGLGKIGESNNFRVHTEPYS